MAILRARKGPSSGAVYPVFTSKQPTVAGRDAQCDAALGDARASRRHASISIVQGEWILEDMQSSNGTFLGGKKVDRARIGEGSVLQIGATLLSFHPDELLDLARDLAGYTGSDTAAAVEALLAARAAARTERNWAIADDVRDGLTRLGFSVEDTPQGARVTFTG